MGPDFRAHYRQARSFPRIGQLLAARRARWTIPCRSRTRPGRGGVRRPDPHLRPQPRVTERRHEVYHSESELVTSRPSSSSTAPARRSAICRSATRLTGRPTHIRDRRDLVTGDDRARTTVTSSTADIFDVNGDYEFALGPGRLKLIGLRHCEHEPLVTTQILRFDDGDPTTGTRFSRNTTSARPSAAANIIGRPARTTGSSRSSARSIRSTRRAAVRPPTGRRVRRSRLSRRAPARSQEVRYEGHRHVQPAADLQPRPAGRRRRRDLARSTATDDDLPPRKFFRPKGSVTLGWRPAKDWDASLKLRRRVGQISFYDFLAQPKLADDRENAGNPDLVPPQSWEAEDRSRARPRRAGARRGSNLRITGSRTSSTSSRSPNNGQGVGNLPQRNALRLRKHQHLPCSIRSAGRAPSSISRSAREWTSVKDPLTGTRKGRSAAAGSLGHAQLRHDIPHTPARVERLCPAQSLYQVLLS